MLKKIIFTIYLILMALAMFIACESEPEVAFIIPPMTVPPQEATPAPAKAATPAPQRTPAPTKPPLEIPADIREININDSGQVTKIYLYGTNNHPQFKVGLVGTIYGDASRSENLGRVRLTRVTKAVSEAMVLNIVATPNKKSAIVVFTIAQ
jgi:hypothetical protein